MNIEKNALYAPEIPIDYRVKPYSKLVGFDDRLNSGELSIELLKKKLMKEKYVPHLQEFAQVLRQIKEASPQILASFPKACMVRSFVTGLLHNEGVLKPLYRHTDQVDLIAEIVRKAIDISNEDVRLSLQDELVTLEAYKRELIEKFQRMEADSIRSELDNDVRTLKMMQRPEISLTWDNLMAFHASNIGLRHLSSVEKCKEEFQMGCFGDAISIKNGVAGHICKLLVNREINARWNPPEGFFRGDVIDSKVMWVQSSPTFFDIISSLSEEDKQKVVDEYEEALWNWVHYSIFCFDNSIDLLSPKENYISRRMESLASSSSFLVIDGFETFGLDFSSYKNFGKCGKSRISSNRMKTMISIPKDELEKACVESPDKSLTGLLTAIDRAALLSVYKQVLKAICSA